jgi:hypothetical protein
MVCDEAVRVNTPTLIDMQRSFRSDQGQPITLLIGRGIIHVLATAYRLSVRRICADMGSVMGLRFRQLMDQDAS